MNDLVLKGGRVVDPSQNIDKVTDIAFASGFSSVRRFNHLFRARYRLQPSALRRDCAADRRRGVDGGGRPLRRPRCS